MWKTKLLSYFETLPQFRFDQFFVVLRRNIQVIADRRTSLNIKKKPKDKVILITAIEGNNISYKPAN